MTEYSVSTQHIRDYKNSKARTADWVSQTYGTEFYSPSIPRSELDNDDNLSEPSDVESSDSIPPKLMLRYGNGRPDEPIPHVRDISNRDVMGSMARSQTYPQGPLHRSGSSVHGHGRGRGQERFISPVPEEIRVLPPNSAPPHHMRSKSLPRNAFNPMQSHELPPPPNQIISKPLYPPGTIPTQQIQPPQHIHISRSHHPVPIQPYVYAPSNPSRPVHYNQPAIYSHPPKVTPNGMIYSHSAPVPSTQYSSMGPVPYSHAPTADHRRTRKYSTRSSDSGEIGSTYYVHSSGRQNVHTLPTPELTHSGGSSTSRSPTTPVSAGGFHNKKPFFHRLMNFAERLSSVASSKGSSHGGTRRVRRSRSTEHL